jgi:hypothetical protein
MNFKSLSDIIKVSWFAAIYDYYEERKSGLMGIDSSMNMILVVVGEYVLENWLGGRVCVVVCGLSGLRKENMVVGDDLKKIWCLSDYNKSVLLNSSNGQK